MLLPLAQSDVAAAPASAYHFDPALWIPSPHDLFRSGGTALTIAVAGLLVYVGMRRFLGRVRLIPAYFILLAACILYFGAAALKPQRFLDRHDSLTFVVHRAFIAIVIVVGLFAIDRLIVLPILSRGGRVAVPRFIHQIIVIVLAGFAIVLYGAYAFGWDIDRFLAGSAVVSIVLGLALQESLGNFFSGLVLQASPPFAPGHWIVCAGLEGRVVDMTWRAVTLHTDDDNHVIIPNATVAKEQITNLSSPTTVTSRDIRIGLDYELAPHDAVAALRQAALDTAGVLHEPVPVIYLLEFADSAIVYRLEFWIDQPARHLFIEQAVRVNVWYRVKQKGYNIPFPIRTVEHTHLPRKQRQAAESATGERARTLAGIGLFAGLSEDQLHGLAATARDQLFAPGQVLFRQNDPGECFYVIRHGSADVLIHPDAGQQQEVKVATLSAGDFFGEMSALTGQPRTASVRAGTPLACIEIDKADLLALFEADPARMEQISLIVAQRNAERAAIAKGWASAPAETVQAEQKSILRRMLSFFRLPERG